MIPVWVELHVDDLLLGRDPAQGPALRALLSALAAAVEARGARLSFRLREAGARACGGGLLPGLVAAGHEVGVHAHGQGLAAAIAALRAAGIDPTIGAPGLVQAGDRGRAGLLAQCRALGLTRITDQGPHRAWAGEGLLPRAEEGLAVLAPTLRPTDWGLYDDQGRPGAPAIPALRRCEALAQAHGAIAFGLTLHEHDLCAPGSLRLSPARLDPLLAYVDGRVVPAGSFSWQPLQPGPPDLHPPTPDWRLRLHRLRDRLPALPRPQPRRAAWDPDDGWLPVGPRRIAIRRLGPAQPRAIVLLSHGGLLGGRRQGLRPFGLDPADLLAEGLALYLFDRAGTGDSPPGPHTRQSPGHPDHQADWTALLHHARSEGLPLIALTWSAGLVAVLQAAVAGAAPDAILDAEGPADRFSLQPPPHHPGDPLPSPFADQPWAEPVALLPQLALPYHRLQGQPDHRHGPDLRHAHRLLAAHPRPTCTFVAGPLHGSPAATVQALRRLGPAAKGC